MIVNVTALLAEENRCQGLELIVDVADDVPNELVGDPLRLGQVLINYANNAVKFAERGEVAIRVRRREAGDGQVKRISRCATLASASTTTCRPGCSSALTTWSFFSQFRKYLPVVPAPQMTPHPCVPERHRLDLA